MPRSISPEAGLSETDEHGLNPWSGDEGGCGVWESHGVGVVGLGVDVWSGGDGGGGVVSVQVSD